MEVGLEKAGETNILFSERDVEQEQKPPEDFLHGFLSVLAPVHARLPLRLTIVSLHPLVLLRFSFPTAF